MGRATDEATFVSRGAQGLGRSWPALLGGGVALLLTAVASWLVLAVAQIEGYRWDDSALVPADGAPHAVPVDGGEAMVWSEESVATAACVVADAASGDQLRLAPTDAAYRRHGGSPGDWVGVATFEAPSGNALVTCTLGDGSAASSASGVLVAVEPAPALPPWLAGLGAWVAVPLSLGAAGVLALCWGALARMRRVER